MTRLEAAEKAVVEAAFAMTNADYFKLLGTAEERIFLREAVTRLRALREGMPECGQIRRLGLVRDLDHAFEEVTVRCRLSVGHGGEHEGDMGVWKWE